MLRRMTMLIALWSCYGTTFWSTRAIAADGPTALQVEPAEISLTGPRGTQQIITTGVWSDTDLRDVTTDVTLTTANPKIVAVESGRLIAKGNGETTVTVQLGKLQASVPVKVTHFEQPAPITFHTEVLGALTKAGCNMGACHGSPSGKGGFRLSLRGYDPVLDLVTLRKEFAGRRINRIEPDSSLILRKPLMDVPHGGGKRMHSSDPVHAALRQWIVEGLPVEGTDAPQLTRLEVFPKKRIFTPASGRQQLVAVGHFSDGSTHDLTALTQFSSSSESVATVNEQGLVTKQGRGETAVLARYLDKMDNAELTFLDDVPGFEWNHPLEANFIDQLVDAKLQQLKILPSDLCSDDEFLRRVYLDVAGRLPSVAETQAFQNDATADKRTKLIDTLLDSADHAAFWSLKWADVLRVNSGSLKAEGVAKFNRWLYDSVYFDQPMNEFAQELLTAAGSAFENPAANYWRASREPADATETTAQLFLGVRIQCAKCHNHPFERWTQDNYYGVGAAFARVGRKKTPIGDDEFVFVKTDGEVQQPRTGQTMKVHLLLEGDVDVPSEQDRREVFANWLTKPDNPFFAKSLVNRMWGHVMGRGIVEPVDDFRDSNPPSNAELLSTLATQFVENGYSRKWLLRTILNSQTYQRSARPNAFNEQDEIYCSHASTRMLSAEQLLDAICSVTEVPEKFAGVPTGFRATYLPEPPTDNYFLKVFGQPQRQMSCECERSNESNLAQALQMINGPTVHDKLRSDAGRVKRLIDANKTDEEIIRDLYLSAVCREPTTAEMTAALKHMSTSGDSRRWALEDIGWAVLNTKEFLFQH
ncbi:MAG: DUF1553 domain-containing protein [Planctomycetaceae bacterium]